MSTSRVRIPWSRHLDELVVAVVEDLVDEIDPDSERWSDRASLKPIQHELGWILDRAIADWLLKKKREYST